MKAACKTSPNYDLILSAFGSRPDEAATLLRLQWSKLVTFFNLKGAPLIESERLADEVVDIAGRRLQAAESVGNIRAFMFETAKFVWLNHYRVLKRQERALGRYEYWLRLKGGRAAEDEELEALRIDCCQRCLARLKGPELEVLREYSWGNRGTRQFLAEQNRITRNSLSIRINRLRTMLRKCCQGCVQKGGAHRT